MLLPSDNFPTIGDRPNGRSGRYLSAFAADSRGCGRGGGPFKFGSARYLPAFGRFLAWEIADTRLPVKSWSVCIVAYRRSVSSGRGASAGRREFERGEVVS